MFGKTDDLTIIKTLTSTLNDSVKGYRDAAEDAQSPRYKELFSEFAGKREQVALMLQEEVVRLGGDPDVDGSTMGSLHQAWLDLKSAVTGHDDKAIINEVERGEDYLKEKFEAALKDDHVTGETRAVIDRAWTSVREGHDTISNLKHSLEA
jgi:uncharacterized protein (TIGR02284 family)